MCATLAHTPVIFLTAAYHEREARLLAQQCGVVDILTKPSESKAILAKVDAVLAAGDTAAAPRQDPAQFNRDHLRVVSSALESTFGDFQASEQRDGRDRQPGAADCRRARPANPAGHTLHRRPRRDPGAARVPSRCAPPTDRHSDAWRPTASTPKR